jgi:hypothetical protein
MASLNNSVDHYPTAAFPPNSRENKKFFINEHYTLTNTNQLLNTRKQLVYIYEGFGDAVIHFE